jgi:N-acetylglucosaminyl-diphospho-decaprenol L-rhamnosyltransferase
LQATTDPVISVIILNYNGEKWMTRCLESLRDQTVFGQLQVIVADNASSDGSDQLAERLLSDWRNGLFVQNGANLGFGAGSNRAVENAQGKYLFFLNPDVWLEKDCLEKLLAEAERTQIKAAGLVVLDYDDDTLQTRGATGFDILGQLVPARTGQVPSRLFAACGFYFIERETFNLLGKFDENFFLYGEENDLSWRIWISGGDIIHVPAARMHHRGAALANPRGGTKIVEVRTNELKRFYANRNNLLVLLKNCQHLLLGLAFFNVCWLMVEGLAGCILLRRPSFLRHSCLAPIADCWRLRRHIFRERRKMAALRRRSDFWMLRFLSHRFSRGEDIRRILKLGLPKVDRSELPRT